MTSTWRRGAVDAARRQGSRIRVELAVAVAMGIVGVLTFHGRATSWAILASLILAVGLIEADRWWGLRYPVPDRSEVAWHRRYGRLRLALAVPVVVLFLGLALWFVGDDDSVWAGFGLVWGVVVVTTLGEWALRKRLTT
ncbi:hypothetical protein [Aeromicrobium alkaliterrae]|uniref:Uncharacterized protein n=1 Tax=Aeromicrobium alkaliterrae TaxID=302168 RepID=A0ABP4VJP3_9ACTN